VAYDDLVTSLRSAGVPLSPAECHGSLCGLLCTGGRESALTWLEDALVTATGSVPEINELRSQLIELTDGLVTQLSDPLIGDFQPLVPQDDSDLALRTESLARWADSFLGGLGLGGIDSPNALSDEAKEALTDLAEIAKLDSDEEASEELEAALTEVYEYLRVVVQLLSTEFSEQVEEAGRGGAPGGATLH
jgi:uncharacterized protein